MLCSSAFPDASSAMIRASAWKAFAGGAFDESRAGGAIGELTGEATRETQRKLRREWEQDKMTERMRVRDRFHYKEKARVACWRRDNRVG